MENKIILELISKNIEEIKFLFETMLKEEKPDHLLIEITALKAKTLYQELKLLIPKESLIEGDDFLIDSEKHPIVEQTEGNVQNREETGNEISTVINAVIVEVEIEETIETPDLPAVEDQPETISEIATEDISPDEELRDKQTVEEILPSSSSEIEPVEVVSNELVTDTDASTLEEEIDEKELENIVTTEELKEESIPVEEPVELIEIIPEVMTEEIKISEILNEDVETETTEKKVFGEQFVKEPSLNDKLASTQMHESKIKAQPISNIKGAIGLNDRFIFTRELFGNDSTRYESTIDKLDELANILEAVEFLEKNFQWTRNDASLKFMDLVKRRFDN